MVEVICDEACRVCKSDADAKLAVVCIDLPRVGVVHCFLEMRIVNLVAKYVRDMMSLLQYRVFFHSYLEAMYD